MIDWAELDRQYGRSPGMIETLVRTALDSYSGHAGRLRAAADRSDFGEITFVAHSIKGSAGYLAAADLREQARLTEFSARAQHVDSRALAQELAGRFEAFLDELRVGRPNLPGQDRP
jgi:HPt (histidine-containing phosphotransfer) domain-containing protein